MRILFLTQWFTPEPFFKGIEYVNRLRNLGHEVFVLTGFPNYPGGKLYDGYKIRAFHQEHIEDVPVLRTAIFPSHDSSSLCRFFNYLSFAMSSAFFGIFKIPKVDVVYVYHPPATVGLPALFFKSLRRIPCVYEIQDIWPDTLNATGMVNNRFILKLVDIWCKLMYRFIDKIIVISPGFKRTLVSRGVKSDKIEVIYNCCDEQNIYPQERNEDLANKLNLSGKFNVMFAGNMGLAQALCSVLDAAAFLVKDYPKIQFVFIGGGVSVDSLKKYAEVLCLRNALFLNGVSPSEVGKIFMLADVMLVHLKDDPLFEITIPGKIQAYMAAGKPIISGVKGDAADLLDRSKAGISCKPEDPRSIAGAVKELYGMPREKLDAMGKNALKFYKDELSVDVGLNKLNTIFQSVLSQ